MFKILDFLKPLTEEWVSDPNMRHPLSHPGSERGSGRQDHLLAVSKELMQAWGRSLHCKLQLQTRLEFLLRWAESVQQDGGIIGGSSIAGLVLSSLSCSFLLLCFFISLYHYWYLTHESTWVFLTNFTLHNVCLYCPVSWRQTSPKMLRNN